MTIGGGIDVKVARHLAIRGQAEYLLTRFADPTSSTGAKGTQNNVQATEAQSRDGHVRRSAPAPGQPRVSESSSLSALDFRRYTS
jgi:hypothetical protein